MPINQSDITVYKDLAEKGNYDAIVELATDSFVRIANGQENMDEKETFDAFIAGLLSHEPGKAPGAKNLNIYKNIIAKFNEKAAANVVAVEKDIRENEKKIMNGEITELSLLSGEPKKVRKAAEAVTFSQTAAGIKQQAYFQMYTSIQANGPDQQEIIDEIEAGGDEYDLKKTVKNALKTELMIADNTLNNTTFADDLFKAEFNNVEKYNFSQRPVDAGENIITSTDRTYESIKAMSDDALVKELAKKEREYEKYKDTNKEMLILADDAKKLKEALSGIHGFDGSNQTAAAFASEVENLTKYGTSECTFENTVDIYSNKTIRTPSNAVSPRTYALALNALKKAAVELREEYAGQNTDEARAAHEAGKKAEEFVREHEERLKIIKTSFSKSLVNPERDIFLIRQEQTNRMLFDGDCKALAKDCRKREQKAVQIGRYISNAQRGLNILAKAADWMTSDKETHGHPSASYTNFATAMAELGQMNAETTPPDELLEKMQQTYDAAAAYEEQHTGKWHPFTGISDNGKDRISYSRLAKSVLGRKIAELRPMADKLKPILNGLTPVNRKTALELENQNDREILANKITGLKEKLKQNKSEKQAADSFLDKQISDAQAELGKIKEQAGQDNYPDKEACKVQYAKIVTATMLKVASKRSKYVPQKEKFDALCRQTETSETFRSLCSSKTSEQIYKEATAKEGQQLFHDFMNIRSDSKQADANAKDNKSAKAVKEGAAKADNSIQK
ncbi:hypothetical protein SAMN02910317_03128 [Ruminococcaceae bacterium FB2012]|nr:hypothetical protein SAMN02910317_03128 [Ruminococcaceae bacterium FB2012]